MLIGREWIGSNTRRHFGLVFLLCVMEGTGSSQAPETFEQALRQRHVGITQPALIAALRSPEKEVRGLAAAELAEIKATAALPDIIRAAQDERDALTQVNIAAAATWMGSAEGLQMLKNICADPKQSAYVRIHAAGNVFDKQDHACFPALVEMMRPTAETDARIGALERASQIRPKTEQESKLVLSLALEALADQDIRIRLEACDALRWLNDPAAIAPLRRLMENEREEAVRSQMESSLNYLLKAQSQHEEIP
jgi:HEAT repeat protein